MSEAAQAALLTVCGRATVEEALTRSGLPIAPSDVVGIVEAIRTRCCLPAEANQPSDVIFGQLALDPEYVDTGQPDLVDSFRQDLGQGAAWQQETTSRVGVITRPSAWSERSDVVAVSGQVEAWEQFDVVDEPGEDESSISEILDLWETPRSADKTLRACWTKLIDHPQLAVEVAYREFTDEAKEEDHPLDVEIGPQFVSSMKAMGYTSKVGRIKRAFYAAAYVGCQRSGELKSLEPHPYRRSAAANSKPVENSAGARLMRGSLGKGNNANRLMWWDGPAPVILGVVGHNDDPRFLFR